MHATRTATGRDYAISSMVPDTGTEVFQASRRRESPHRKGRAVRCERERYLNLPPCRRPAPSWKSACLRELGEVCLVECLLVGVAPGDHALFDELLQCTVHGLHAHGSAALHDVLQLIELALADEIRNRGRVDEDLERRDT